MTRPEPIHAEHCRCGRCAPPPIRPQSPVLCIVMLSISAAIALALLAWAGSAVRDHLLTFQTF